MPNVQEQVVIDDDWDDKDGEGNGVEAPRFEERAVSKGSKQVTKQPDINEDGFTMESMALMVRRLYFALLLYSVMHYTQYITIFKQ